MFQNGCELVKVDFHLHTHKDKEFKYAGDDHSFVKDYVAKLKEKGIRVGVITNHNKFDLNEYKAIKKAAKKEDIFILPGVELSVKEGGNGVHTLIVFNPDEWIQNSEESINNFITSVFIGISNRENENTRCLYDLRGIISQLNTFKKDYFIVMAHIEQKSGFLKECEGGLITTLAEIADFRERVLALQKLRTIDNIAKIKQWMKYELAFVEGSDPKKIDEIGKGTKFSYLKIGSYSYGAIKYALQDFKNRLFSKIHENGHSYIKSASFTGGKLDDTTIELSPELNTLIGVRGSGKSSILEAIRYALDIQPSLVDSKYKTDLVKNSLSSGGQISLQIVDRFGTEYEVRRIMGDTSPVLYCDGKDLSCSVQSIINNPLYFGQKDLSFTDKGYELSLLKKLVGEKLKGIDVLVEQWNTSLVTQIHQLNNVSSIPEQIKELEEANSDLEHKLEIFREKGVADKLKKQTSCNSDLLKLQIVFAKMETLIRGLDNVIKSTPYKELDLSSCTSEYNSKLFASANCIIQKVIAVYENGEALLDQLTKHKAEMTSVIDQLSASIDSFKGEFAEIKREIKDDKLDLDSFVQYTKDAEENKQKISELSKGALSRKSLISAMQCSIDERNKALMQVFSMYEEEIKAINRSQTELRLEITFKGDKEQFKESIKNQFKGTSISESKYQNISNKFSDFVSLLKDYYLDEGKELHNILTDIEYGKLSGKIANNYEKLISIECPNLVKIYYHDKLLEQHSIGQRASALILFILTQQNNDVIIIDQPEDDLDNQVIYREVIRAIKEKKPHIQFIFATHNANIPVLGDAERIITTTYNEDKITVDVGNIDCVETHKEVVDIMEGGKEAFEKRKMVYTAWG